MKLLVVSRIFLVFTLLMPLMGLHAAAQAPQSSETLALPLLFDPREKPQKPDLSAIRRVRFITTVDYPPFNFIDQFGKISGFHVDLAREICKELNILDRCQIEALPFAEARTALDNGDGEVLATGLKITPELREAYRFSRPFLELPARFMINKADLKTVLTPDNLAGKQVGVLAKTKHEQMAKAYFPAITLRPFEDREALYKALRDRTIAAAYGDSLAFSFWTESEGAEDCCRLLRGPYYSSHFFGEGLALMSRKDMPQLARAIDAALIMLARSGRLNEIYLRYFPSGL